MQDIFISNLFRLSGTGDLLTICISRQSRNRFVGEEIAKGLKLSEILSQMDMVAERVETSKSVYNLTVKMCISAPITTEVYKSTEEPAFSGK